MDGAFRTGIIPWTLRKYQAPRKQRPRGKVSGVENQFYVNIELEWIDYEEVELGLQEILF